MFGDRKPDLRLFFGNPGTTGDPLILPRCSIPQGTLFLSLRHLCCSSKAREVDILCACACMRVLAHAARTHMHVYIHTRAHTHMRLWLFVCIQKLCKEYCSLHLRNYLLCICIVTCARLFIHAPVCASFVHIRIFRTPIHMPVDVSVGTDAAGRRLRVWVHS